MSENHERGQLDRFRQIVATHLGLRFEDDKLPLLATVVAERRLVLRLDLDTYLSRLEARQLDSELRVLAERLTVGETYFFRNRNDLDALTAAALPDRLRVRAAERRLRILSIGCASGEEPYTIAMLLRDFPQLAGWEVSIRGVDVNPAAIARAREGWYAAWSLRQTPSEVRSRFFRPARGGFRVVDQIHDSVTFEERNVVEDDPALWVPGQQDVVFCRNMIMYFTPEVAKEVIGRIADTLASGGFLFLGHAETLRGVSHDFHLLHTHGTFYYQLRGRSERAAPPARPLVPAPSPTPDASWVDVIRGSSERVADITTVPTEVARPAAPVAQGAAPERNVPEAGWVRVMRALELLRHDRHADALSALGGASPEEDADTLLLRAVLLASVGDPDASERVCALILEKDELNAEAHYVMALCREHAGDRAAAADHDHYALYLDPGFAMPRLHLGLLAKRDRQAEAARRELSRALVLLASEDASRILLLGGGFSRDALLELCRAELRACGGTW